jgi:ribose transport system ATP-binding protein
MLEIAALCHRATVLRDGMTVGVVDIAPGAEERIVELMLGARVERATAAAARGLGVGRKLADVSFELHDGEVLALVALEGQGQDELFAALSGGIRPTAGAIETGGRPIAFAHPADAIAAGIALVPGDRAEGRLMQRSVRENIALTFSARLRDWGPIHASRERSRIDAAIARLQIDTRAQREVQRLSGGNQQKVTIARWIAAEARTILCFDPTRGIDVRTKAEIYRLLRELAGQGRSILFYTSELEEVQRVADRVVVLFAGRVVDTFPAAIADEATLTRAAYGLPRLAEATP